MDTVFVAMYHPALGNVQVQAALIAVPTYQLHGWLLVDPNATPPPLIEPWLTEAAGDSRYLRAWEGAEAVLAGAVRYAPDGHVIVRAANGTTRATYDATEQGLWTAIGGASVSDAAVATQVTSGTATQAALKAAFDARYLTATVAGSADDPDITLYLNGVAL